MQYVAYMIVKLIGIHFFVVNAILSIILILTYKLFQLLKSNQKNIVTIGFLHPNCNDCGGGEKVLWMMIKSLTNMDLDRNKLLKIHIYSASDIPDISEILIKLKQRFNLEYNKKTAQNLIQLQLIKLKSFSFLKEKPYCTMLLQIIGQMIFALEILIKCPSHIYLDSTGLPFTYSILSIFSMKRSKVISYVHYPFISHDMISDIENSVSGVHSRGIFTKNKYFRQLKVYYYRVILLFYKWNGGYCEFAHCNSSWTYDHIIKIWGKKNKKLLYPPCSTSIYAPENFEPSKKMNSILSFAQFRPEKNQKLQIEIFKRAKENLPEIKDLKFYMLGSIRGPSDQILFDELNNIVISQNLQDQIIFKLNLKSSEVKEIFNECKIGIHTMKDEHFGISIIEMMAAGLITIAHKSAGPLKDIIGPAPNVVGYLSEDMEGYVRIIVDIMKNYPKRCEIVSETMKWTNKFSDEYFRDAFFSDLQQFINN